MKIFFSVVYLLSYSLYSQDIIKGLWFNQDKDAKIQFYAQEGKIFGKVVWLKTPLLDGKPKIDVKNPIESLRLRPIMGLVFLQNFEYNGTNQWVNGSIYDPKSGKTYKCEMTLQADNTLKVRGYIGAPMFGRSVIFTHTNH